MKRAVLFVSLIGLSTLLATCDANTVDNPEKQLPNRISTGPGSTSGPCLEDEVLSTQKDPDNAMVQRSVPPEPAKITGKVMRTTTGALVGVVFSAEKGNFSELRADLPSDLVVPYADTNGKSDEPTVQPLKAAEYTEPLKTRH